MLVSRKLVVLDCYSTLFFSNCSEEDRRGLTKWTHCDVTEIYVIVETSLFTDSSWLTTKAERLLFAVRSMSRAPRLSLVILYLHLLLAFLAIFIEQASFVYLKAIYSRHVVLCRLGRNHILKEKMLVVKSNIVNTILQLFRKSNVPDASSNINEER
jgi:hypothetical protein